ncbi:MAG: porin family protein [Bacteroidales bacterium]
MKRLVFLLLGLLLATNSLQAFEPSRMHPSDRFFVTLFTDAWQNVPDEMDLSTIQRGINISAMQDMPMGRSNFSIAAGLEFSSHNLYSDHRYLFYPDHPLSQEEKYDFAPLRRDYDKNKLSLNYLEVPVQFRYRTRGLNRTFRIYAGIKAGYLVNAHTKYEGKDNYLLQDGIHLYEELEDLLSDTYTREIKTKEHRLGNLADYRIGLTAMVGYGSLNLHLYYPLTKIFEDNSASDMYPVSVGVSLILF